jgi:hypothetical protein
MGRIAVTLTSNIDMRTAETRFAFSIAQSAGSRDSIAANTPSARRLLRALRHKDSILRKPSSGRSLSTSLGPNGSSMPVCRQLLRGVERPEETHKIILALLYSCLYDLTSVLFNL